MSKLKIIAGPCSVNEKSLGELNEILSLNTKNKDYIYGVRVVGLKSRTELKNSSSFMGMDFDMHQKLTEDLINGKYNINKNTILPSLEIAKEIHKKYPEIKIATEVVDPFIQVPIFAMHLEDKFIPWNPAVNQLGWNIGTLGHYAKKYNLTIGIKNAKNLGISITNSEAENKRAPMEKTWKGLATYSGVENEKDRIIMIHRGIDDPSNGDYRNFPVHKCAERVKKDTNYQMFFDPSHIFGPKLRDKIVEETINAMKIKIDDTRFLYDGILIEVGTSTTDTEQHITIKELSELIDRISQFRD